MVSQLAELADTAPGTSVVWASRSAAEALYALADDPLPVRRALHERARALAGGAHAAVTHVGGVLVEGFEFNSATHRYRAILVSDGTPRIEEVDQIIVATGFGPDNSIYRELQVHECYASRGPMKLSSALMGANATDCMTTPAFDSSVLANPEPDFWILGNKSYGRSPNFLLETGYRQVADVVAQMAEQIGQSVKA